MSEKQQGQLMFRVMIAEDDLMIADLLEGIFVKAGYQSCGIAGTVSEAIELGLRQKPHIAILDLRLADSRPATEIAAGLSVLGKLGVLYTTANISRFGLTSANGHACLAKPYSIPAILRSLEIVMDLAAARTVAPPFPPGFRVLRSVPTLALSQSFGPWESNPDPKPNSQRSD